MSDATIRKFSAWASQQNDPRKIEEALNKLMDRLVHEAQITLRDKLAMAAIPMSLTLPAGLNDPKLIASHAYKIADEMIAARKEPG